VADDPGALPPQDATVPEVIDTYLAGQLAAGTLAALDRDGNTWYARIAGEDKDYTTVWLTLGQRALSYEAYFMPAPEEHARDVYELLLLWNHRLRGAAFTLSPEHDVFLRGQLDRREVTGETVDRILGTIYQYAERFFRTALELGYPAARRVPARGPAATFPQSVD